MEYFPFGKKQVLSDSDQRPLPSQSYSLPPDQVVLLLALFRTIVGFRAWLFIHLNVFCDDGHIFVVHSSVNLVHEVERHGLVVVQGEHQSQRAQCLLFSAQVGNILPALFQRTHTKNKTTSCGISDGARILNGSRAAF